MIERTLILIHRDALERNLEQEILDRFIAAGLKVLKKKTVTPTKDMALKHYRVDEELAVGTKTLNAIGPEEAERIFGSSDPKTMGKEIFTWSRDFIADHPLVAAVLEGEDAIKKVRSILGSTDPVKAQPGTIRRDFGEDSLEKANSEKRKLRNLVHASDSPETAKMEIELWFPEGV